MNLLAINKLLIIPQLYENQNADEHIEGSKHIQYSGHKKNI